jgi:hypothetical protein
MRRRCEYLGKETQFWNSAVSVKTMPIQLLQALKDRIISALPSAFVALYHNLQTQVSAPDADADFGGKVLNTISLLSTFHSVPSSTSAAEGMLVVSGGTELFSAFQTVVSGSG